MRVYVPVKKDRARKFVGVGAFQAMPRTIEFAIERRKSFDPTRSNQNRRYFIWRMVKFAAAGVSRGFP